jgi:hypothetical protein
LSMALTAFPNSPAERKGHVHSKALMLIQAPSRVPPGSRVR